MRPIRTFTVVPSLPPRLERLRELAYNLRWAWDVETLELFRRLDVNLWEASGHNPVRMLGALRQDVLDEVANDDTFLSHLSRVAEQFDDYMNAKRTWFRRTFQRTDGLTAAYFSMEFGISESLPNYSGGLGVLAGDHLKSASDLGVPLVGVGLLYQEGYFRQYLNADRLAGGDLSGQRLLHYADRVETRTRWQPHRGSGGSAGPYPAGAGVEGAGGAGAPLPARCQHRRQPTR